MPVILNGILTDFQRTIQNSQQIIVQVRNKSIHQRHIETISELVFLKIFTEWEFFLENSFVRFMVGGRSPSGFTPHCFICPPSMKISKSILKGESKEYINWNSASAVKGRAKIYFRDGEPYVSALDPISQYLDEMNTIRNRIAHKSDRSKTQFSDLTRRKIGHGILGITPGKFLLMRIDPSPSTTYLDQYITSLIIASRTIVP